MDLNKFDYIFEQVDFNRLDLSDTIFSSKIYNFEKRFVPKEIKNWIAYEKIKYKNQEEFAKSFNNLFNFDYKRLPKEAQDFNHKNEGNTTLDSLEKKLFHNKKHRLNLIEEYSYLQNFIFGKNFEHDPEGLIFFHPEIGPFFSFPFLYGFSKAIGYARSPQSWNKVGKGIFESKMRCYSNLIHKPFKRLYQDNKTLLIQYANHTEIIKNTYKVADKVHQFISNLEASKEVA